MHNIYIDDVIRLCGGKVIGPKENLLLSTFCTDTRKLKPGDVYVGIVGEVNDGNDYYREAIEKGASCLILSKEIMNEVNIPVILVDDTLKCLQVLASYKRETYDIPVIAITGSVGKTSTKDIIASVVSQKYKTHKTIGNYNNHLGVPLTILSMDDEVEALVIEMGMNHLGEISLLSRIAKPSIAVITNVGTAHIGNLGSRENILKAKLEILDGMNKGTCLFNADNDMLFQVIDKYGAFSYGIDNDKSTWCATDIKEDVFSSSFFVKNTSLDFTVNIGGKVFIYNALAAIGVGEILGIDVDLIRKGIASFKLSSGRLEKKVSSKGFIIIDDTYNANYDSMKASLELLGKIKDKRKIAILGDMLELGDYTNDIHLGLGDIVFDNKIDILITVGEASKLIGSRCIELGMNKDNIYSFDKEVDTYQFLDELLSVDDIVLLKGSHGIHLGNVVDYLMKE